MLAFSTRDSQLWDAVRDTVDLSDAPRFPTVRMAVVVAMVVVASPYLARPLRRVGQVLVLAVAIDALYIGKVFPTDLLGAVVLGWCVAAGGPLRLRHADRAPDRRVGRLVRSPGSGSR